MFPKKVWAVKGQDGVLLTLDEQNACEIASDCMPVQAYVPQRSLAEAAEFETLMHYRITMQTIIEQQLVMCQRGDDFERTAARICLATIFDSPAARHTVATGVNATRTPLLADMLEKAGDSGVTMDLVIMCGIYIDKHLCRKCKGTGTYTYDIDRGPTFEQVEVKCDHRDG